MDKHINYIARTFDDYKSELLKFSKKYYPEIAESYEDSTIGSWLLDVIAGVGDNLSYTVDRMAQEQSIDSANLKSTVLSMARTNGVKVPGAKASMCEVAITCRLPLKATNGSTLSEPDWRFAPVVKRSSIMSAGNTEFQLDDDIDFASQFNSDAFSDRTFGPVRDANGQIIGYDVTKTAIAINGGLKIYKKVITDSDLKPFMEIVLPDLNVMNVESILFKETANFTHDPEISEFYVDAEEFTVSGEDINTYRFFEVESLADQYRFGTKLAKTEDISTDINTTEEYDDYTETGVNGVTRTTRCYRGMWKPIVKKFITEFTDNGYLKITFGSGVNYETEVYDKASQYGKWRMSKVINNNMLGELPNAGWTMYILYRSGGGISSNIAPNAINSFSNLITVFRDVNNNDNLDIPKTRGNILNSITVTNTTPALAGKDAPSVDELKHIIKYNIQAQDRCVTVKDYKSRLMMMPPKYGAPFRASVVEENNKIVMKLLNLNANGKMVKELPDRLAKNISEYMSNYKQLTDYLDIRSGKIYNIGFAVDLFISKNYNNNAVVANVINVISKYMAVASHDMGEDIFVGDIEKEISLVEGVISLINLNVYMLYNGAYSIDRPPLPTTSPNSDCLGFDSEYTIEDDTANFEMIDLSRTDMVLYCDSNAIFEVKYPETDIQIRCKIR